MALDTRVRARENRTRVTVHRCVSIGTLIYRRESAAIIFAPTVTLILCGSPPESVDYSGLQI